MLSLCVRMFGNHYQVLIKNIFVEHSTVASQYLHYIALFKLSFKKSLVVYQIVKSTIVTIVISNNNRFYYVCIAYWNTFNRVCTDLTIFMDFLSVILNLCSFFQIFKIVTEVLTKLEHFHCCK